MYAVIESGGKQHKVEVGQIVDVDRLPFDVGADVVFDRVLMVGDGDGDGEAKVGAPILDGAQVKGAVVKQGRAKKVLTFIYKKRQNSNRRRAGHRQDFTSVKIDAIEA